MKLLLALLAVLSFAAIPAAAQSDEIVANLAGGRVIILVAGDGIVFAAINHPLEATSVPPRVATVGSSHVGVFFGASEWQVPAQPRPIRLDRNLDDVHSDPRTTYRAPGSGEADLELIGVSFLERLRPLVSQLHHKIDLKPDEPLFEIVLIGYAPKPTDRKFGSSTITPNNNPSAPPAISGKPIFCARDSRSSIPPKNINPRL